MEITYSWQDAFPDDVRARYDFAETRNAAAILRATTPEALDDIVDLLANFELTLDKLTTPGGNRSVVAKELDETMRVKGWREARFDQKLTTTLTVFPWKHASVKEARREQVSENEYGGHKVDNVLGRATLDVEWNPKDGNLDRDFGNFVSLHEGGIIDTGIILTRHGDEFSDMVRQLIATVKAVEVDPTYTAWHRRMNRLANDPFGTTTTANFGKLVPRIERGDGRGCPILAIAITAGCYVPPQGGVEAEVHRLAEELQEAEG